jgi:hypothetical protein
MCESSAWLQYPDGRSEKIADDVLIVIKKGWKSSCAGSWPSRAV